MISRVLDWEGCTNVRDLGGLRTGDGRTTRWRAIVRSDSPARLTSVGWAVLHAYGIRTTVTLHTHGMQEEALLIKPPYAGIATAQVAIEDITDEEFLQQWASSGLWSMPLYYADALRRWPERHAAAIATIARAQPGGLLFHLLMSLERTIKMDYGL